MNKANSDPKHLHYKWNRSSGCNATFAAVGACAIIKRISDDNGECVWIAFIIQMIVILNVDGFLNVDGDCDDENAAFVYGLYICNNYC